VELEKMDNTINIMRKNEENARVGSEKARIEAKLKEEEVKDV